MINEKYDAVIIGARVAGSILASMLGDVGYKILLVDTSAFPSSTISTHFFRGAGLVSVLNKLDVLEKVLALGCPRLKREYVYRQGGTHPESGPPQNPGNIGYCLSVRRRPLDYILVQRAAQTAGVHFMEKTRATELIWDKDRVAGVKLKTPSGELTVRAGIVIGADGRHSFVAKSVNAPIEVHDPATRAIYYCYVQNFPAPTGKIPDGPEFSFLGDEIAYTFPSDQESTCLAISVNLQVFRRIKKDYKKYFWQRIAQHKGIAERLKEMKIEGQILGSGPIENYVRVPFGSGWALVGDAGLHLDPWTGQGMALVSQHASYLAESLIDWFEGRHTEASALRTYHQRRNETGLGVYEETVRLAKDLRQLFPD